MRPNSYVVLLPSHCRAEPNTFCWFLPENNRLDLVRHGSGTTYGFGLRKQSVYQNISRTELHIAVQNIDDANYDKLSSYLRRSLILQK